MGRTCVSHYHFYNKLSCSTNKFYISANSWRILVYCIGGVLRRCSVTVLTLAVGSLAVTALTLAVGSLAVTALTLAVGSLAALVDVCAHTSSGQLGCAGGFVRSSLLPFQIILHRSGFDKARSERVDEKPIAKANHEGRFVINDADVCSAIWCHMTWRDDRSSWCYWIVGDSIRIHPSTSGIWRGRTTDNTRMHAEPDTWKDRHLNLLCHSEAKLTVRCKFVVQSCRALAATTALFNILSYLFSIQSQWSSINRSCFSMSTAWWHPTNNSCSVTVGTTVPHTA